MGVLMFAGTATPAFAWRRSKSAPLKQVQSDEKESGDQRDQDWGESRQGLMFAGSGLSPTARKVAR